MSTTPRTLETELAAMTLRAEKAESSLHDLNLDLSTANHMIKLERDRADALQTRLKEIESALKIGITFLSPSNISCI